MRKFILFFPTFFLFIIAQSQTVITVQHGSTTTLETRLDSAVSHAQDGDYIYLPGGLISGSVDVQVNKKLSIIGAGYHPDSSSATTPTNISSIIFTTGSSGSLITGVFLTGDINISSSDIAISRCFVNSIQLYSLVSNLLIEENIIRYRFVCYPQSGTLSSILFRKNIIYDALKFANVIGNIVFLNNIFFSNNVVCNNSSYENNIFISVLGFGSSAIGPFNNNLFVNIPSFPNGTYASGNIVNEPVENIFVNYPGGGWNKSQNYHLKPGCRGIGLSTDKTDVGIYGSATPFKEGGIPFNPHFKSVVVPSYTNPNGMLNINITVQAQNH